MKLVLCSVLCLGGWLMATTAGVAGSIPKFSLSGTDYIRLEDWAEANRMQLRWAVPKQQVKLSSTWTSLAFEVDSRRSLVNGVAVYLSHPAALRNGSGCIAWKDVTTVLQPLLNPPKNAPGKEVRLVCLDPGHGGKDPGKLQGSQSEKKYTLLLAQEVSTLLRKSGVKTHLTRSRDSFVELGTRPEMAVRKKADLFISLHFNSADGGGGSGVRGSEVYCMTPAYESSTNARGEGAETGAYPGNRLDCKNVVLAYHIQKALVTKLKVEDRGVKRARLAVLRTAEMPAVVVEGGFMSNREEAQRIYDPIWRRELARAIVDGILAYKKIVEL